MTFYTEAVCPSITANSVDQEPHERQCKNRSMPISILLVRFQTKTYEVD